MGLVDNIRRYIFQRYIKPSVERGEKSITLRAGDIHNEMRLHGRIPAVCNALGSKKSIELFNMWLEESGYKKIVTLTKTITPPSGQGSNSYYTYSIEEIEGAFLLKSHEFTHFKSSHNITEEEARMIISKHIGVPLYKRRVNISGKHKEFDLVNLEYRIVGDFKNFKYKGQASAEMSNIIEYVWLMEKLEKFTGTKWRKMIVGAGNEKTFETFARRYNKWLGDIEIYFISTNKKVKRIR